jgi:hypothetical protein
MIIHFLHTDTCNFLKGYLGLLFILVWKQQNLCLHFMHAILKRKSDQCRKYKQLDKKSKDIENKHSNTSKTLSYKITKHFTW